MIFSFFDQIQKPTPQLKVLIISISIYFFDLIHLNIFKILIFDRSISEIKFSKILPDLRILSIKPPPVICAHELIKSLLTRLNISFT